MKGYQIKQKLSKMDDDQLVKKYNVMNIHYDEDEDINLEVYFKLVDELKDRFLL